MSPTPRRRALLIAIGALGAFLVWVATLAFRAPTEPSTDAGLPDAGEAEATPILDAYVRVSPARRDALGPILDAAGIDLAINASGGAAGAPTLTGTEAIWPLCNLSLAGTSDEGFAERIVRDVNEGCRRSSGVFVPSSVGLGIRTRDGLLALDDAALDPLFASCADRFPVVLDVGGPGRWFGPDGRFTGTAELPEGATWPTRQGLWRAFEARVARHRDVRFVVVDWGHADAATLGRWLDRHDNLWVVTSGPPPEGWETLLRSHSERFLFGSGLVVTPDGTRIGDDTTAVDDPAGAIRDRLAALRDAVPEGSGLLGATAADLFPPPASDPSPTGNQPSE